MFYKCEKTDALWYNFLSPRLSSLKSGSLYQYTCDTFKRPFRLLLIPGIHIATAILERFLGFKIGGKWHKTNIISQINTPIYFHLDFQILNWQKNPITNIII